ncbi:MAG: YajQ family cyclic di-GMP-binding protein [Bacteriovoracaceae bacterium]|jgi:cyclic-di-GMP-binding protein|nr:YajQ family cyclic di-GMP-binding protein [Bacteriovoracaceae bacterium]
MPSFDLVSSLDMGEVKNVVIMAQKQIKGRYDFKDSNCTIEFKNDKELELKAESEMKLKAALEIFYGCMVKRKLGLKSLEVKDPTPTGNQMHKQTIVLNSGIDKEKGKEINKIIKKSGFKVSSAYLDEKIRVTGKKIDDLQSVYQLLRNHDDVNIELRMENMK